MRRLALAALLAAAASLLVGSAAFAQPAEAAHSASPVGAHGGVPAALQADPRNPFERGQAAGEPGRTGGGTTAGPAAPGTVAGGGALPRTGGSRAARLMGMAASLMTTGGAVLWAARYRPRHAA